MPKIKRIVRGYAEKKTSCDCGRNVTGSQFFSDHGSCQHCYYGVTE